MSQPHSIPDERLHGLISRALGGRIPLSLEEQLECRAYLAELEEQFEVYEKALSRVEEILGTVGLSGLPVKADEAICTAWAIGREKRPDPELIPRPVNYVTSNPAEESE